MKWISVENKSDEREVVIGWVKLTGGWTARSGILHKDRTFWMNSNEHMTNLECTHWMPLPDSPKEGNDVDFANIRKDLQSEDVGTRDSAGIELSDIDDPIAIPWLEEAIAKESNDIMRNNFQLVIDQLVVTKKEGNDG